MSDLAGSLVVEIDAHLVRFIACSQLALDALDADDFDRLTTVLDARERVREELERAVRAIERMRFEGAASARRLDGALERVRAALDAHGTRAGELQMRLLARAGELRAAISNELAQLNHAGAAAERYAVDDVPHVVAAAARLDRTL